MRAEERNDPGMTVRLVQPDPGRRPGRLDPAHVEAAVSEEDERRFLAIVSTDLTPAQIERVVTPPRPHPQQRDVLAVHWHPEFIPLELITRRIAATFPQRGTDLIIPTQHNVVLTYEGYCGAEVDCYSRGFNQKVQLLVHYPAARDDRAEMFRSMLAYTYKYRATQLHDLMHTITHPLEARIEEAVARTGADPILVRFVEVIVGKVARLVEQNAARLPADAYKNKLLRDYLDELRPWYGDAFIARAQAYLREIKTIVKAQFPTKYFYRTEEVIEEARSIGAGIVIPHPEQFWPILLAEYDVDGYEVWNPQSRRYSEFLISNLVRRNAQFGSDRRRLLVFMGDDTHMGEKAKDPAHQDETKVGREIGVQPAWADLSVRKKLIMARMERADVIAEYRARLQG